MWGMYEVCIRLGSIVKVYAYGTICGVWVFGEKHREGKYMSVRWVLVVCRQYMEEVFG